MLHLSELLGKNKEMIRFHALVMTVLIISNAAEISAKTSTPDEQWIAAEDGVEYRVRGVRNTEDPIWGVVPTPNSRSEITKFQKGKELFTTAFTIGADGYRVSSASRRPGKSKHLLLLNGSFVFGDGLSDEQTLAHLLNKRSDTREAYPLAYSGYGPQQTWLRFHEQKLPSIIAEKKGSAVMVTHEGDIRRIFGALDHLFYTSTSPRLIEKPGGGFERVGSFASAGTVLQRALIFFCVPFIQCRSLMSRTQRNPTEREYETAARLFADIQKMYRAQFEVESFVLLWRGDDKEMRSFSKYWSGGLVHLPELATYADMHANANGVEKLVQFLFDTKLVH